MDYSSLADTDLLMFNQLHGSNSAITNSGRTAIRPNATGEFNDAIVISNRALKDNELFEVIIEKMVDRWSGSIEAGKYNVSGVILQQYLNIQKLMWNQQKYYDPIYIPQTNEIWVIDWSQQMAFWWTVVSGTPSAVYKTLSYLNQISYTWSIWKDDVFLITLCGPVQEFES